MKLSSKAAKHHQRSVKAKVFSHLKKSNSLIVETYRAHLLSSGLKSLRKNSVKQRIKSLLKSKSLSFRSKSLFSKGFSLWKMRVSELKEENSKIKSFRQGLSWKKSLRLKELCLWSFKKIAYRGRVVKYLNQKLASTVISKHFKIFRECYFNRLTSTIKEQKS